MRIPAIAMASLISLSGCSCGDDPAGIGLDDGATATGDGAASGGDGATNGGDGATSGGDGATSGGDGAISNLGDGAVTDGDPLVQPLPEFCRGMGSVVTVGTDGLCAGDLAEETFQFGLCACETIAVQSNLELDAFDSRLGPYGGANIQNDGNLGINGALDMDGKLTVRGNAYVGGGGFSVGSQSLVTGTLYANGDAVQDNSSTTIERNAFIDGNVQGRYQIGGDLHLPPGATIDNGTTIAGRTVREQIPAVTPCPCGQDQILDIAAITAFGRTRNDNGRTLTSTAYQAGGPAVLRLPCGRYYLTRIAQPGGLSIVAEGRTVLFVDGDMDIGGSFDLTLEPGAEVDLFVNGSLSVGASARFGDPSQPSKVRTYVGGANAITLNASAVFGGNLYAPRAEVTFTASSDLYGALFARRVAFGGSASVHFDRAVRRAGDACEEPVPGTDGGVIMSDAGPTSGDVGPSTADSGPVAADATPAPTDAGGAMCSGCFTPEQTPELCGACSDDLDCCAPYVCIAGDCRLNF